MGEFQLTCLLLFSSLIPPIPPHSHIHTLTQSQRTKGNCLRAGSGGGEGPGLSSNNVTCHDYVDLSVCFEDTAILIGICVIFWLLAGLKFLVTTCTPATRPLPFSRLHASKLVRPNLYSLSKKLQTVYCCRASLTGANFALRAHELNNKKLCLCKLIFGKTCFLSSGSLSSC